MITNEISRERTKNEKIRKIFTRLCLIVFTFFSGFLAYDMLFCNGSLLIVRSATLFNLVVDGNKVGLFFALNSLSLILTGIVMILLSITVPSFKKVFWGGSFYDLENYAPNMI